MKTFDIINIAGGKSLQYEDGLITRDELIFIKAHFIYALTLINSTLRRHNGKNYQDRPEKPIFPTSKINTNCEQNSKSVEKRLSQRTKTKSKMGGKS